MDAIFFPFFLAAETVCVPPLSRRARELNVQHTRSRAFSAKKILPKIRRKTKVIVASSPVNIARVHDKGAGMFIYLR